MHGPQRAPPAQTRACLVPPCRHTSFLAEVQSSARSSHVFLARVVAIEFRQVVTSSLGSRALRRAPQGYSPWTSLAESLRTPYPRRSLGHRSSFIRHPTHTGTQPSRSEEHTSELQSQSNL